MAFWSFGSGCGQRFERCERRFVAARDRLTGIWIYVISTDDTPGLSGVGIWDRSSGSCGGKASVVQYLRTAGLSRSVYAAQMDHQAEGGTDGCDQISDHAIESRLSSEMLSFFCRTCCPQCPFTSTNFGHDGRIRAENKAATSEYHRRTRSMHPSHP